MNLIKNYVPILRWKEGERVALAELYAAEREQITPLFEFIMPGNKTEVGNYKNILEDSKSVFLKRLPKVREDIKKCWPEGAAFVDVHLVDGSLRADALQQILDLPSDSNITLIPVTHIIPNATEADVATRKVAIDSSRSKDSGICIRISRFSLQDEDLGHQILKFVKENNLDVEKTDILVDLEVVSEDDSAEKIAESLAHIPLLEKWRSFIVSGGAFPKDLTEFEKHSLVDLPRTDWLLWNDLLGQQKLTRRPIYSDYTIQHPILTENIPGANPSASVRYASDTQWKVFRGEGLRNKEGAGHQQYKAHAQLLKAANFFKGSDYCFGDKYIVERTDPENKKPGSPRTWLTAGINHHITLAAKQNAS
jgi:hypothetical protein